MSDWLDIQFAPKDGTPILAYGPEYCGNGNIAAVLKWHAFPSSIGGGMWDTVGASGWEYECDLQEPTHFMPLPVPPPNLDAIVGEIVDAQFEPADMTDEERAEAQRLRDTVEQRAAGLDATVVARAFEVMLPARTDGLRIEHNPHMNWTNPNDDGSVDAVDHMPIAEYLKMEAETYGLDFTGPVEQQKAIETGQLWLLEWVPPGELVAERIAAASLPALAQWLQDNGLAFGS